MKGVFVALFVLLSSVESQDFASAAEKCCSSNADCCLSSLRNNSRVTCFGNDGEAEALAADCLQKEIFGEQSLRFATFDDTECCAVFDMDDNDSDGSCRSTCSSAMTTPSFSSKQKLNQIKTCRKDNETYTCFRRCQLWLRGPRLPSSTFPVHEHCNASSFMKPGRVYLGEELVR